MSYIKDGIHRTDDEVLIKSLQILADNIQSDDGVANECIREAALRLEELINSNRIINEEINYKSNPDNTIQEIEWHPMSEMPALDKNQLGEDKGYILLEFNDRCYSIAHNYDNDEQDFYTNDGMTGIYHYSIIKRWAYLSLLKEQDK
jgi:hypothetical protein